MNRHRRVVPLVEDRDPFLRLLDDRDRLKAENERLRDELNEARETNRRLNRRCQDYEAGLAEKLKNAPAQSLGRALSLAGYRLEEKESERLRAELTEARARIERDRAKMSSLGEKLSHARAENSRLRQELEALREPR